MDLFEKFFQVLKALKEKKVDYILIGGFAVILHGMPRLTQDIDIFVKMNPGNVAKLQEALYGIFQDDSINNITIDELKRYSVIRYGSPDGFYIDIMARLGEVAAYDNVDCETMTIDGIQINVATPEALFNLKKDTPRPEDKRDAVFLSELLQKQEEQ
jgi:predicted nucleotidyltransferase